MKRWEAEIEIVGFHASFKFFLRFLSFNFFKTCSRHSKQFFEVTPATQKLLWNLWMKKS